MRLYYTSIFKYQNHADFELLFQILSVAHQTGDTQLYIETFSTIYDMVEESQLEILKRYFKDRIPPDQVEYAISELLVQVEKNTVSVAWIEGAEDGS